VNVERLGRLIRTLRVRQRLTQHALAARAGVSRQAVSTLECGRGRGLRIRTVESVATTLDARIDLRISWSGPELDRLLDATHAATVAVVKRRLERWAWLTRVEVSFSRYGERGRIDLLCWHPATRALLVAEIKTDLVDVQDLLGSLDVKTRLSRHVAERFGWEVRLVVPAIVFVEHRAVRNRLMRHAGLFDRFDVRGRAALAWVRRPVGRPSGVLWFQDIGDARRTSARRVYPSRRSVDRPSVNVPDKPDSVEQRRRGAALSEDASRETRDPSVEPTAERP
jgi:transcriptional regulator with XRE-family HTH domain